MGFFKAESSYIKQTYNICYQNLKISNEPSNFKTSDIQQYLFVDNICTYSIAGGAPIWIRQGCSSEILNLTPKGDHLGVTEAFETPKREQSGRGFRKIFTLKETALKGKKEEKENLTSVSLRVILCFFNEP